MSRYYRRTAIQAISEVTYGVDPDTWAATDAILVRDATFMIERDVEERDLLRNYLGGSEKLVASRARGPEVLCRTGPVRHRRESTRLCAPAARLRHGAEQPDRAFPDRDDPGQYGVREPRVPVQL